MLYLTIWVKVGMSLKKIAVIHPRLGIGGGPRQCLSG